MRRAAARKKKESEIQSRTEKSIAKNGSTRLLGIERRGALHAINYWNGLLKDAPGKTSSND